MLVLREKVVMVEVVEVVKVVEVVEVVVVVEEVGEDLVTFHGLRLVTRFLPVTRPRLQPNTSSAWDRRMMVAKGVEEEVRVVEDEEELATLLQLELTFVVACVLASSSSTSPHT